MNAGTRVVAAFIVLIFVLVLPGAALPPRLAGIYFSLTTILMGFGAIACHKWLLRGDWKDLGFRLDRNAALGVTLALVMLIFVVVINFWLQRRLGYIAWELNANSPLIKQGLSPLMAGFVYALVSAPMMFVLLLIGEELAFSGFLLPKLTAKLGAPSGVALTCLIFGLWHIPAYFSVYQGGVEGWSQLAQRAALHGLSWVPVALLFLRTRELYGVSLYHAGLDAVQYVIFGSAEFGEASRGAVFLVREVNAVAAVPWITQLAMIVFTAALCRATSKAPGRSAAVEVPRALS